MICLHENRHAGLGLVAVWMFLAVGCGSEAGESAEGAMQFEPNRPSVEESGSEVEPYEGSNEHVLEAQQRLRTPLDLHRKVIQRTCSPSGGVCHNRKEYPDLHTPANFLSTVGAPCNVQPGELASVYDRCERPGDRFRFRNESFNEIEIGYVERVKGEYVDYQEEDETPDASSPGLHVHLNAPVPLETEDRQSRWATGQFVRTFVDADETVRDLAYFNFQTRWWILGDGSHLMAEVRDYQSDEINDLLSVGVTQGDLNRNGTYGARESADNPVSLLEPGSPEESYLIARMRGKMEGERIPGTQMPLANQPLSISEMLALYCFVEGLPEDLEDPPEGTAPIDYKNCSYSDDPEQLNLLGEGVSWTGRVSKVLEANCGGCHGGESPAAEFDILSDEAYANLLADSTQKPEMARIEPGSPEESYLWLKINARHNDDYAEQIEGEPMPVNPVDGEGTLSEGARSDIETWIENGATDD